MCGIIDDAFNFVKDSAGEIFSHPLQAAGAALGVPGYDPFFGGLFNKDALISPTGNFTSSAWNDMYNANPNDSGALNLFHSVNDVADKVAPAVAGYYGGPLLAGASNAEAGAGAAFTTGLEGSGASTLGGLESGLGGSSLFGASAGTGTAIGSSTAEGLGAGGLGVAGGDALGGTVGTTYGGALGGSNVGTGLGGSAALPGSTPSLGGGAVSAEGGQAATTGPTMPGQGLGPYSFEGAQSGGGEQGYGNLSALYGSAPDTGGTVTAGSPTGQVLGQTTAGVSPALTGSAATGGNGVDLSSLNDIFKLGNSLYGAWQNQQQANANQNYVNSIKDIFSPNGAYAQQMKSDIARQFAAQGRNSQGSPQSVELAARLAGAQANALGNSNYARAATTPNNGFLNTLFAQFGNNPGQLFNAGKGLYNAGQSLYNLF